MDIDITCEKGNILSNEINKSKLNVTFEKGYIHENYLNDLYEFLELFITNNNQEFSMIISIFNDSNDNNNSFEIINQRVYCIYNVFINNNLDCEIKKLIDFMNNEDFDEFLVNNVKNTSKIEENSTFSTTKKGVYFLMEGVNIELPIFIDDLGMKFRIEIENSDIVFDSRTYDPNIKINYNELKLKKLNNDDFLFNLNKFLNDHNNDNDKTIKFSLYSADLICEEVELIYNYYINYSLDDAIKNIKYFMIKNSFKLECINYYSNPNNYLNNNTFSKTKKGVFFILKTKKGYFCCLIDDKEYEFKFEVFYKTCSIFFGLCSSYETYTYKNSKNTYVFDQ